MTTIYVKLLGIRNGYAQVSTATNQRGYIEISPFTLNPHYIPGDKIYANPHHIYFSGPSYEQAKQQFHN